MSTLAAALPVSSVPSSRRALIAGRVCSGLAVLFLAFDAVVKFLSVAGASEATQKLGWDPAIVPWLGGLQLVLLALYLFPRTAVLGALLWTGYLGGAVATHVRVDNPLFSHVLFPTYIALLLWGGLWLRDTRLRSLLPLAS
jgi:hypothetical protein